MRCHESHVCRFSARLARVLLTRPMFPPVLSSSLALLVRIAMNPAISRSACGARKLADNPFRLDRAQSRLRKQTERHRLSL